MALRYIFCTIVNSLLYLYYGMAFHLTKEQNDRKCHALLILELLPFVLHFPINNVSPTDAIEMTFHSWKEHDEGHCHAQWP